MPYILTNPTVIKNLLLRFGLKSDKSFGQHFLIDPEALRTICATANLQSDDTVIEIGTGTGVLTQELARSAARIISYEVDKRLAFLLSETVGAYPNIELRFWIN